MKNPELYNKTVEILVQSYLNDTLVKGSCACCAVGNIIAANSGVVIERVGRPCNYGKGLPIEEWYGKLLRRELLTDEELSTGYTTQELTQIESAFESNTEIYGRMYDSGLYTEKQILEDQYNGLMAVIDVLDKIHENTDSAVTEKSKALFVKA